MQQTFSPPASPRVLVAHCFDEMLARDPDAEALVTRSGRYSVTQFDRMSAQAAQVLTDLGVQPGDRVAACLPNDVEILAAFHGAMRVGAIWVGINENLATPEKSFMLADSGASVLLSNAEVIAALGTLRADLPDLSILTEEHEFRSLLDDAAELRSLPKVDPDAPAGLGYTSGTTGRPKGAVHSQRNLLTPGVALSVSRGWGEDLRKGDCFALTILNMMVLTMLTTSAAGGTAVIMDTLSARGVTDWIEREGVTVWNGPPALLHTMASDPEIAPSSLRTLREAWSGGAATPEELRNRFMDRFGVPVIGTYGLTEAPTVVSIDPPDGTHRAGVSGHLLPHLRIEVRPVEGVEAPAGELCLAPATEGPWKGVFTPALGYWNRPEASAELLADGVLHTGDVGEVTDGWLRILDRRNLMIIRGGANIYPAEVERVLSTIEGIRGCCVIGIPDERLGERVGAVLEVDNGVGLDDEDIKRACTEQLASYKVPERIVRVAELPRNAMGKVERAKLPVLFPDAGR